MDMFNAFPDVFVVIACHHEYEFVVRIFTTQELAQEFINDEGPRHPHYRYRISARVLFSANPHLNAIA